MPLAGMLCARPTTKTKPRYWTERHAKNSKCASSAQFSCITLSFVVCPRTFQNRKCFLFSLGTSLKWKRASPRPPSASARSRTLVTCAMKCVDPRTKGTLYTTCGTRTGTTSIALTKTITRITHRTATKQGLESVVFVMLMNVRAFYEEHLCARAFHKSDRRKSSVPFARRYTIPEFIVKVAQQLVAE